VADETPALLTAQPTWLISQVSAIAHRMLADRLAAAGARGYHVRLLAALAEFGPSSQADLGRRTAMDRSDVVATVNELADQRLAQRSVDPTDRRRNVITITPGGAARLEQLAGLLAGVQDELLAPLTLADRDRLANSLTQVLDYHAGS